MITSRKDLVFYLQEDKRRNIKNASFGFLLMCSLYHTDGYRAYKYLKALRYYEYSLNVLKRRGVIGKFICLYYRFRWHRLSEKYNILIPPNVCGFGLRINHIVVGGGIIINCKSMGCYCSVNTGVIVGNNGGQDRIATIGDNVSLTIGSKVIGSVVVGDNVIIAPNSVVVKDVPPNAIVSGVPAKIIRINGVKVSKSE